MIGRQQEFNLKLNQFFDCLVVGLAFWLGYSLRAAGSLWFGWAELPPFERFYWQFVLVVPFTPLILERLRYYVNPLQKTVAKSLRQLCQALVIVVIMLLVTATFARASTDSRAVLGLFPVVAIPLLLLRESLVRTWMRGQIKQGRFRERVVFAGPLEDVDRLIRNLPQDHLQMMDIVARVDIAVQPVSTLVAAIHETSVGRVIFAASHVHFSRIEEAVNACELEGVEAWLWADFIQTSIARPTFDAMANKPMLVFRCTPEMSWEIMVKGIIDRVGAFLGILLSSPLWLIAVIGIKLSSPGPVFFSQMRSGRFGKPFRMYKFRTMGTDAEARRADLEEHNQMSGPVFKVEKDPRIFAFGQWLRKLSIDELPQFINILSGDMSLVGPRPLPVYEIEKISDVSHRRRLSVKPGLTCLWQISGRNEITSFDQWVELDLKYIDNWSLWLDITIMFRTIPAVLFGFGAK
ncbi:MAG: Exopolysaccharide biosynthesis polyprenyl glycosylphosphotransferase [Verrucomicrobiales bacterium]|nr:Exopolysaccharide biosynthesis polyprenyl glycosylphosphotransferase [Verrucomicrobiales bacterium]